MIVLDTNVLSELMRPRPSASVLRWTDGYAKGDFCLTAISVQEIVYGIWRVDDESKRAALSAAFEYALEQVISDRVLAYDEVAGRLAGELSARLENVGRKVDIADVQIAAIARQQALPLATRNIRHFTNLGIELMDPWHEGTP